MLCCVELRSFPLYCVLYIMLCYVVLYCIVLYCIVLYCIILYYIIKYSFPSCKKTMRVHSKDRLMFLWKN